MAAAMLPAIVLIVLSGAVTVLTQSTLKTQVLEQQQHSGKIIDRFLPLSSVSWGELIWDDVDIMTTRSAQTSS